MGTFDTIASALLSSLPTSARTLPERQAVIDWAEGIRKILFPHLQGNLARTQDSIRDDLGLSFTQLRSILESCPGSNQPISVAQTFFEALPELQARLLLDAQAIERGDPAAKSVDEVIVTYPGFLAITLQRIAHEFYTRGIPLFPRMLTEYAHEKTGIDIHPGAVIGASFCIDHGTGIVIGETAVIGCHVKVYQGVTLGALSVKKEACSTKRHPTIEDHVVIYSGATILGGNTVIGEHSIVGGNVWITESLPRNSVVYHDPAQTMDVRK